MSGVHKYVTFSYGYVDRYVCDCDCSLATVTFVEQTDGSFEVSRSDFPVDVPEYVRKSEYPEMALDGGVLFKCLTGDAYSLEGVCHVSVVWCDTSEL